GSRTADNIGVHGLPLDIEKLTEPLPQTRTVQNRPAAQDEMSRPGGSLDSDPGQHVDRIGYKDHDRARADPVKLADNARNRVRVGTEQVKVALTRTERHSRRDDHHITATEIGIAGGR